MNKPIVLIVDDQANLRKLLRLSLCQEYDVLEAEDGAGALKLVREQRPQVVILDVMMPGEFDGIEVCRQIKKDPALAHTGVVMVTARHVVAFRPSRDLKSVAGTKMVRERVRKVS